LYHVIFLAAGGVMRHSPADQGERRFSEESVREIVQHAVALQQQRDDTYTESQVRSLLAELGTPSSIVNQALRHAQVSGRKPRPSAPLMPVLDSALLGVCTGLATATALPFLPGSIILVPAMWGAGLMFAGILAARNAHVSMARFQTANLALWSGMAGAFLIVAGATKSLLAPSATTVAPWAFPAFWAFASVAGAVLTKYDGSSRRTHRLGRIARRIVATRATIVGWIKKWASSLTVRSATAIHAQSPPSHLHHRTGTEPNVSS
jgi:hypothetical protein